MRGFFYLFTVLLRLGARFILFIYGLWNDALVPPSVVCRVGG
jgi:hypothetical protein